VGELVLHGELQTPEHPFLKDHPNIRLSASHYRAALPGMIQQKGQLHLTRWKWFFGILLP